MKKRTMTQTQEQTPQYLLMTTRASLPSPANKLQPSSSQTCDRCSPAPLGAACSLVHQHVLELEVLFEDHGVCSGIITDSLDLERVVYEQHALAQPPPTAIHLGDRQKGIQLLLDLAVTCAFPAPTSGFALQILDLTHVWANRDTGIIGSDDLLAFAAAVYMHIKPHLFTAAKVPAQPLRTTWSLRSATC